MSEVLEILKQKATYENWPIYQIFDLNMASDYPFGDHFHLGQGKTDLVFTCQPIAPISVAWNEIEPAYTSIYRTKDDKPFMYLYRQDDFYVMRYTDAVDFYIGESVIVCHILDKPLKDAYVMNLLTTVLALWLEFQGIPCLHASAVEVNDLAIAFLADSGRGKSTLAASFLQAGYPLLTDDKLPLEQKNGVFWGRPGVPSVRIFPEVAEQLVDDFQNLDLVTPGFSKRIIHVERDAFGSFCRTPKLLACIYILERKDANYPEQEIRIVNIMRRDAIIELIRYDFTTLINATLGFSVDRLNFYSQLAASIPVKCLTYPAGQDRLPEVCSAILKDLERLA